jgi:hypothetical protein
MPAVQNTKHIFKQVPKGPSSAPPSISQGT